MLLPTPRLRLMTMMLALCLLTACGGKSGPDAKTYSGNPWDRTLPTQQAGSAPDTLDMRNQWLDNGQAAQQQPVISPEQQQYDTPATALSGAPVKIALLLPLSGRNAEVGESILNAAQLALFDVGADTFELMPRDTQGTAAGAASAAQSALAEGAQLILGPLFAEEVRAVAPVAQRSNVNVIAFTTDWKLAGGNTYVMGFMPFGQVQRVVSYAAGRGLKNIGVIAPQTEYGNAVINALNAFAPQAGLQIVDTMRFMPGDTTLAPAVQRFARYDARKQPDGSFARAPFDAIFLPVAGSDAQVISNLLSYYEMDPVSVKRLGTGLWDDGTVAREQNLNGGWFAAPDPRARTIFEGKYADAYGAKPPRLSSLGYDATALAAVLAKTSQAGAHGHAFDRLSITNPNGFSGIDGIFRFRNDGLADRGLAVLEMRNGQLSVIDAAPRTFQNQTQ